VQYKNRYIIKLIIVKPLGDCNLIVLPPSQTRPVTTLKRVESSPLTVKGAQPKDNFTRAAKVYDRMGHPTRDLVNKQQHQIKFYHKCRPTHGNSTTENYESKNSEATKSSVTRDNFSFTMLCGII
jgi:hypothetical protein